MNEELVHAEKPVVLVGGGPVKGRDLKAFVPLAGAVVAADGGAGALIGRGILPDRVIGDMDSLAPETRAALPQGRLWHVAEQDSTDFEKCLDRIAAPLILGLGFLGRRLDHSLAALSALVARPARPVVLVGARDAVAHVPARLAVDVAAGTRVSLFPLAPVTGRSRGLEWPIDGLALAPGGRIGTSNRAGGPVVLEMDGPGCLILLPRSAAGALIRAVAAPRR